MPDRLTAALRRHFPASKTLRRSLLLTAFRSCHRLWFLVLDISVTCEGNVSNRKVARGKVRGDVLAEATLKKKVGNTFEVALHASLSASLL